MAGTPNNPIVLAPESQKQLTALEMERLEALTLALKAKLEDTLKNIVSIGNDFHIIKELVGHGQFMDYVEQHFDMSYRTANRFMHVASVLGNHIASVSHLSQRALYLLSSPQLPEETRMLLIGRLQQGDVLTYNDIQAFIQEQEDSRLEEPALAEMQVRLRLKSFSKGFHRLYQQAAQGLPGYSGKLTSDHKQHLEKMHSQIQDLENWIEDLLKKAAEPEQKRVSNL